MSSKGEQLSKGERLRLGFSFIDDNFSIPINLTVGIERAKAVYKKDGEASRVILCHSVSLYQMLEVYLASLAGCCDNVGYSDHCGHWQKTKTFHKVDLRKRL